MWMDLDTGELLTYSEMLDRCESDYGFDDFTPMTEIYNYFEQVEN